MQNDEALKKARVESLRKQIEQLIRPSRESKQENISTGSANETKGLGTESPRDFIHRKMWRSDSEGEASTPLVHRDGAKKEENNGNTTV